MAKGGMSLPKQPGPGQRMSIHARQLVDEIVTTEPKSINVILDEMISIAEETNKTLSRTIPTRSELTKYLSANYNSVIISNLTNKPITDNNKNSTIHYFKQEE
jgi:hypothetical protein